MELPITAMAAETTTSRRDHDLGVNPEVGFREAYKNRQKWNDNEMS
jgi:hypothetical protein